MPKSLALKKLANSTDKHLHLKYDVRFIDSDVICAHQMSLKRRVSDRERARERKRLNEVKIAHFLRLCVCVTCVKCN